MTPFLEAKLKKSDGQIYIDEYRVAAYYIHSEYNFWARIVLTISKKLKNRALDINFLRFRLGYIIALLIVLKLIFLRIFILSL